MFCVIFLFFNIFKLLLCLYLFKYNCIKRKKDNLRYLNLFFFNVVYDNEGGRCENKMGGGGGKFFCE